MKKYLIIMCLILILLIQGCGESEEHYNDEYFSLRPKKIVTEEFKKDIIKFYQIVENDYKNNKVTILWSDIIDRQNEFYTKFREKYTMNSELTPYEKKIFFHTLTLLEREECYIKSKTISEEKFLKYLNKFKDLISYSEPE